MAKRAPRKPRAFQRPNGLWEAKGIDLATGLRKSYYGETEAQAENAAYESKLQWGTDDFFGYYIKSYFPSVMPRTRDWRIQIAWAMDNYWLPEFGHRKLPSITRDEIQAFFNQLVDDPRVQVNSIRKIKIVVSAVFNHAVQGDFIAKNPCAHIKLPRELKPDKRALDPDELHWLIDHSHPLIKTFLYLAACGLRRGEGLGVVQSRIAPSRKLGQRILLVRQQVKQVYDDRRPKGDRYIIDVTPQLKNQAAYRDIPIPDRLWHETSQSILRPDSIFLCSDTNGGVIRPNNVWREVHLACGHAFGWSITEEGKRKPVLAVSPHELRHTYNSILENDLECPVAVAAALVGHENKSVNADYSHAKMRHYAEWMERYWELVSTTDTTKRVSYGPFSTGSI